MAPRRLFVERVAGAFMAVGIGVSGLTATANGVIAQRVITLADFAQTPGLVSGRELREGLTGVSASIVDSGCDRLALTALSTVRLRALETALAARNIAAADIIRDESIATLQQQIACNPSDGLAWLRLAKVGVTGLDYERATLRRVTASRLFAPAEGWIVAERLPFTADLLGRGLKSLASSMETDARTIVSYAPSDAIAKIYRVLQPEQKRFVKPLIRRASFKRFKAIDAELRKIGVSL
jgi:hypothetical protein